MLGLLNVGASAASSAILGSSGNHRSVLGALSQDDLELLRHLEELMPEGQATIGALLDNEGRPKDRSWEDLPGRRFPAAPTADPATRRAVEGIAHELHRYFEIHRPQPGQPTARAVLGGRLWHWAALLLEKSRPTPDEVRWWCEYLRRIEDDRPFTRSNWARLSSFEDALSQCRLILLELRDRVGEDAAVTPHLKDSLEAAHRAWRDFADRLCELLYVALRPGPTGERGYFQELERQSREDEAPQADGTRVAIEDRILFRVLELERHQMVDVLAEPLLSASARLQPDKVVNRDLPTQQVDSSPDQPSFEAENAVAPLSTCPLYATDAAQQVAELVKQLTAAVLEGAQAPVTRIIPNLAHGGNGSDLSGLQTFLELHGLYCLLSALLQRLEISLHAAREYSQFLCFLPVYNAAVLDLAHLLPRLGQRLNGLLFSLSWLYEALPVSSAPPGRRSVLDLCWNLGQQLPHCDLASAEALQALKACRPQETMEAFQGWRDGDRRWLQAARVHIAASQLLPPSMVEEARIRELAESLCSGGRMLPAPLLSDESQPEDAPETVVCDKAPETTTQRNFAASGLRQMPCRTGPNVPSGLGPLKDLDRWVTSVVAEETKLYEAGRHIGRQAMNVLDYASKGVEAAQEAAPKDLGAIKAAATQGLDVAKGGLDVAKGKVKELMETETAKNGYETFKAVHRHVREKVDETLNPDLRPEECRAYRAADTGDDDWVLLDEQDKRSSGDPGSLDGSA